MNPLMCTKYDQDVVITRNMSKKKLTTMDSSKSLTIMIGQDGKICKLSIFVLVNFFHVYEWEQDEH
jgi:hypothetical protein